MTRSLVFLFMNVVLWANSFSGLQSWYHPHRIALTGAGGTVPSVTNDVINPAGIWSLPRLFEVSFVSYPAGINTQSAHLSIPGQRSVTVYSLRHVNYGLFEGKNELNEESSDYYASDTWLNWAAAGHSNRWPLAWGVNTGIFYSLIENKSALILTYSGGVIITSQKLNAKIGISVFNGGSVIKRYNNAEELPPTSFAISISKDLDYLPLNLSLDVINRIDNASKIIRLGGVFALPRNIELKLGTSSNRVGQSTGSNLSEDLLADTGFGIGWSFENYHFESGIYLYGPGGLISGLSIGIQF